MNIIPELVAAVTDPKGMPQKLGDELTKMEIPALEHVVNQLQDERAKLKQAQVMVQKHIGARTIIENAKRKLVTASPEERAAMLQLLQPASIPSGETVSAAGTKRG